MSTSPNVSPYHGAPLRRPRQYAPSNRRMCRRASGVLVPIMGGLHQMCEEDTAQLHEEYKYAKKLEEDERGTKKGTKRGRSSSSSGDSSSSSNGGDGGGSSVAPPTKRRSTEAIDERIAEANLLELAATSTSDATHNQSTHRRAYRYANNEKQFEAFEDANKDSAHSDAHTLAVLLAKKLRKDKSVGGATAAREILDAVMVKDGTKISENVLSTRTTIYQYLRSNWGRRQYMDIRKSQLNESNKMGSPHLLPPFNTMWNILNERLPKPLLDGEFIGPVPTTLANAHLDNRNTVCSNLEGGPNGLIVSPVPENYNLPYAPFVFWRLKSVLEASFDQEIWDVVVASFEEKNITTWEEKYQLTIIVAYGGDGSGTEAVSTKQTDHLLAWGMTVMFVIATPLDDDDRLPTICVDSDHPEFGECKACGQLCVYRHPHPQSPASFRITALGMVNENVKDQRRAFCGPVRKDYNDTFINGFKYRGITLGVEGIESKADAKWLHDEHGFHSSSKHICPYCDCSRDEIKTCSECFTTRTASEIELKRAQAANAKEHGASKSETYASGSGYGGDDVANAVKENKYHIIVSGLHCQIAICGRMFLDLFVMLHLNQPRFYNSSRSEWDDEMRTVWNNAVKHVKKVISKEFSVYLGLRDAAKMSNIILDVTKWDKEGVTNVNHEDLISHFVDDDNTTLKQTVRSLLKDIYDIFAIARSSTPSINEITTFQKRCIDFSHVLDRAFPHLLWPWYMHYLIAHGQDMMEMMGSIGLFNEQSSEHCNKLIKRCIKWNSRGNSPINCLVDTIRRLWWTGDIYYRDYFLNWETVEQDSTTMEF